MFLEYVIDHDGEAGINFNSFFRYMSKDTLTELNEDFSALAKKYQKLAQRDEAVLPRDKLLPVKWTTLAARFEIFGKWPVAELEKS